MDMEATMNAAVTATARNFEGETVGSTVHAFERAGLGKAPFKFVGTYESKFQACPGAPVKPGTSCDYCGEGIMYVCAIRSSDGKTFKVGCDCVSKVGDAGLKKIIDRKVAERRTAATHARQDAKIAAAIAALPSVAAALRAQPHPYTWQADKGATMLDRVQWLLANAGRKGKCEAAKIIDAAAS
jgi:hypothetical protein